ncbi:MAG: hypothetical protein FWB78_02050, partial [Treponema sp.]|nr:hypothetical protein [Treponema sp.]
RLDHAGLSLCAPCLKSVSVFSTSVRFYLDYHTEGGQGDFRRVIHLEPFEFVGASADVADYRSVHGASRALRLYKIMIGDFQTCRLAASFGVSLL